MKWVVYRLVVTDAETGWRLDQYLASTCQDLSRTSAKKVIDLGGVHVNGRRMRSCSRKVMQNDQVEVYLDGLPLTPYRLTAEDIVYRDQYILVLNKPAAVDTQPTHARFKGTLFEALQLFLQDPSRPQRKVELGMVQRLDRGTSGLMVFSIHAKAHKPLTEIFLEHRIEKRYLAIVAGKLAPGEDEIRSLLARSRKENKVKSVERGGKLAVTRYRVVEEFCDTALVEVDLLTGRSHQIRAHLSERNAPLLGDHRYGGPSKLCQVKIDRPLLHAWKLGFFHPVSGEPLSFESRFPKDMADLLESLRQDKKAGL